MADVTFTATTNSDYVILNYPVRPYKSTHRLSIDIEKIEDNTYSLFDNGAGLDDSTIYDTTFCECSFIVPYSQAIAFDAFIRAHRTEDMTLTIGGTVSSGFYPFFPHRGNNGPFTISCEVQGFQGFQSAPYKYFKIDLKLTAVYGIIWPSFSLPSEIPEGDMTIDGITNIRYPESNFSPAIDFSRFVTFDEKTQGYYDTHGASQDQAVTSMALRMNTSKTAALFNQLILTRRIGAFNLIVGTNQYPFGEHYGDNRTFSCKLIQETIELTHQENNMFETNLKFARISG
jgi:hypothetical protein